MCRCIVVTASFSLALIVLACFNPFAPSLDPSPDPSNRITEQENPGEVLQNFRYAYTFKDSVLYSDIIDDSFVFEYFDPNIAPSGGFRTWGRDVDLRTTGRFFDSFDVIELTWLNVIDSTTTDDGAVRYFQRFSLNLFGSQLNYVFTGTAIFTFKESPSDGRWRIVGWKDETDS
jgi:hypothetical protein